MKNILQEMKNLKIVEPVITIKSRMKENNLEEMNKLADEILNKK